ncbi:MAG TPA: ABC transporter permease [Bryobacteraceae bacterium]|jgi:predicted permease
MGTLKHVFRRLVSAPLFSAAVLATLALGIGANTSIFSVINGVLFKPLPYPGAESLVSLWHTAPGITGVGDRINICPSMYFTYRDENRSFAQIGVWSANGGTVTGAGEPDEARALMVTYGVLDALNVKPVLGRWFSKADDTPGTPETVMLGYGYWQTKFGGDRAIVGKSITVDSRPRTVIGVLPASFRFRNFDEQLIMPERFERSKVFLGQFGFQGVARLKPGVTLQQANADIARMLPMWLNAWPTPPGFSKILFENAHFGPKVLPLKQDAVGDIGATLWVIMGTLGLVLLIACANVANLLLVRAEGRQHELAIRAALGAGWGQIAREMLLESLTLGLLGGVLGLVLAYAAIQVLVAKGPQSMPRIAEISIDPLVLAFAVGLSLLSGLFFGAIPVLKYAGQSAAMSLRGVGRAFSSGRERNRARNILVIAQVCFALVLLTGSGLMIRTFQALRSVHPGLTKPEELQILRIVIPDTRVKESERVMRMENDMLDKLAAIPGVQSVTLADSAPLESIFSNNDVLDVEGRDYSAAGKVPPVRRHRSVSPGFFKTMGTPLIAGRDFTWSAIYQKIPAVIISENLAHELWGNARAALGKRVRQGAKNPWSEVIGVAGDVYDNGLQAPAPAIVYWQAMRRSVFADDGASVTRGPAFILRSSRAGTEALLADARRAIWSIDDNLPVFLTNTEQGLYNSSMQRTSFTLVLLAIAGAMALLLGVVGIYGVIAYAVSQRTREIGIRIALGAEPGGLRRMFVRRGLLLALTGAAIGLGAAAAATRLMKTLLFGVTALDPVTFAAVALVLIGAAALASYLPARRATLVDPVDALRTE